MTLQRGEDPRRTPLVAFGGAGGLHAAALANSLGMPRALVPSGPGLLCAFGMASAQPASERSAAVLAPLASMRAAERKRRLVALAREARAELIDAGSRDVRVECALDLRYAGQSFELRVPSDAGDVAAAFEARHRELYGYALEDREVELVALRARAFVASPPARLRRARTRPLPRAKLHGPRKAWFGGVEVAARLVDRSELVPGEHFPGPAIVQEFSGTTLVPPRVTARVVSGGHLVLDG